MKYLIPLCFLLCVMPLWAQDEPLTVIVSGPLFQTINEIASVYWTPDSQGLIFEEKSLFEDETASEWYFASLTAEGIWTVAQTTADQI